MINNSSPHNVNGTGNPFSQPLVYYPILMNLQANRNVIRSQAGLQAVTEFPGDEQAATTMQ